MAVPTLPSFDYREPENFVVRIGTASGTSTSGILGQIRSVSGRTTANRSKKTFRRVGSATATTEFGSADYSSTCDITFWSQTDLVDYLAATGDATPATLDVDNAVTISVEMYDAAGNSSVVWRLTGAAPMEGGFDIDADGDAGSDTVRFESTDKWTTYVQP